MGPPCPAVTAATPRGRPCGRLRSLPGCRVATSPCASRTRPPAVSCAPGSPGSGTSSGCPTEFPADVLAEAEQAAEEPRPAVGRPHRPAVPHHRPARARPTSTRRCTSSGATAATGSATPSPTSAPFVRPGRRDRRRGAPSRRDPLQPGHPHPAAPAGRCPRARRRCCPTRSRRPCCGPSTSTPTARRPRSTYAGRMVRSRGPARLRRRPGRWSTPARADERLQLLAEVGKLRMALEVERGGVSLPIPEQEVVEDGGTFRLEYRTTVPGRVVERADLADDRHGGGRPDAARRGRRPAHPAEGARRRARPAAPRGPRARRRLAGRHSRTPRWCTASTRPNPRHAALLEEATSLLRGAGYTAFDGGVPEQATHAAVAAEYAHATAPLRRLVDRYVGAVCLALCAGDGRAGLGPVRAAAAAGGDGRGRPAGPRARARVRGADGGRGAARPRGPGVRRGGGRAGRQARRRHRAARRPGGARDLRRRPCRWASRSGCGWSRPTSTRGRCASPLV